MDIYREFRSSDDREATWGLVAAALQHSSSALLFGGPGTGKTFKAVTDLGGRLVLRHTFTQDQPSAAVMGHWVQRATPMGPQLEWQDGPALKAWRESHQNPVRLVLDEIQKVGEDALGIVHTLLDDETSAAITLPTGETVRRGPFLQVVGTMNGTPDELDPALRSRFRAKVFVGVVNPEALERLPDALRSVVAGIIEGGEDPLAEEGIRPWLGFVELCNSGVGVDTAARLSFGPKRAGELADALRMAASELGGVGHRDAGRLAEAAPDFDSFPDDIKELVRKIRDEGGKS